MECVICSNKMENVNIATTHCNHCFHLTCITKWFRGHNTCPMCRVKLFELPEKQKTIDELSNNNDILKNNLEKALLKIAKLKSILDKALEQNKILKIKHKSKIF